MSLHKLLKSPGFSRSVFLMGLRAGTLGIKLLLTLYIAKYLGLNELGIFGLIAAAQILLPSAASLGINHSLARHAVTQTEAQIIAKTRGYLFVVLFFYAIGTGIAHTYLGDRISLLMFLSAIGLLLLENINSDAYHLLTNQSKPVFANALHFVRSALWAIVFMVAGLFYENLRTFEWLLIFWLVGSGTAFAMLVLHFHHWPILSVPLAARTFASQLRTQISESWFLYTNGLVVSIGSQSDRYIVTAILGLELTGVYVFYLQVSSALSNLHYTGLIQIQRPEIILATKQGYAPFKRKVNSLVMTSLVTTTLSAITAYFVVSFIVPMLDKPLLSEWHVMLYFALAVVVSNVIVAAQRLYFYALHEDKSAFHINLLSSAIGLVMLYALLLHFSLSGAGVALVLTGILRILMQSGAMSSIEKRKRSVLG